MKVKDTFPRRQNFQSALDSAFRKGEEAGKAFVEVQAGILHRAVGGYPSRDSRMPTCCAVMRAAMMPGDVVLAAPPKGKGASLAIRFALPRGSHARPAPPPDELTHLSPSPALVSEPGLLGSQTVPAGAVDRVVLVSCVKGKRAGAAPARDLYTSPLFRGMRAYAEHGGDHWFILSAKHGVLRPDEVVAPYELTLNRMPGAERQAWAARVQDQLTRYLPARVPVVILAGARYRELVEPALRARGHDVSVPMQGLTMGQQLRWLKAFRGAGA